MKCLDILINNCQTNAEKGRKFWNLCKISLVHFIFSILSLIFSAAGGKGFDKGKGKFGGFGGGKDMCRSAARTDSGVEVNYLFCIKYKMFGMSMTPSFCLHAFSCPENSAFSEKISKLLEKSSKFMDFEQFPIIL